MKKKRSYEQRKAQMEKAAKVYKEGERYAYFHKHYPEKLKTPYKPL